MGPLKKGLSGLVDGIAFCNVLVLAVVLAVPFQFVKEHWVWSVPFLVALLAFWVWRYVESDLELSEEIVVKNPFKEYRISYDRLLGIEDRNVGGGGGIGLVIAEGQVDLRRVNWSSGIASDPSR